MIVCVLLAALATTEPAIAPGLRLNLTAEGSTDSRVSRLAAIAVPAGTAASTFLPPGPFTGAFEGFINLKLRGDYHFLVEGRGAFELFINDQQVLTNSGEDLSTKRSERVRMKKGANLISLRYSSPRDGDSVVRLYWAEKDRPMQPVSPLVLTHDPSAAGLQRAAVLRRGQELFDESRCARCHVLPHTTSEALDAPSLSDIGARLHGSWMVKWIESPRSIRADASMPRVFRNEADARDAAAYLATLGGELQRVAFAPDDLTEGAHLFTGLGCIACHNESAGSLDYVPMKWKPAALVDYLRDPHRNYASSPMPDFKLTEDESRRLAAYLVGPDAKADAPIKGDPARGRSLVRSSGCINCHTLDAEKSELAPIRIGQKIDAGCLAGSDRAPDFAFHGPDREAIKAFLSQGLPRWQVSPIDRAQQQITKLNCVACHARDSAADTWSSLGPQIGEIESKHPAREVLPMSGDQARPSLTWTGEKLRTDWVEKVIAGKLDYRPRPWLAARMPAFAPARAKHIAEGMSLEHGFSREDPAEPQVDQALARIGQALSGRNGGFSCNNCHAIGSAPPTSAFEAQGVNFMYTQERMRPQFYMRWVMDPMRYEPGTRMPQYRDAQGTTAIRDTLGGDATQQFKAIWEYLRAGRSIEPAE